METDDLECPLCTEPFSEAVETPCCHRCYDRECLHKWLTKGGTCPDCRKPLAIESCTPNMPLQRIVNNLPLVCPNATAGCTDKITRGILADHRARCSFSTIPCPLSPSCGAKFLRRDTVQHTAVCEYRPLLCPKGCGASVAQNALETHYAECPETVVSCPLGCRDNAAVFARRIIPAHLADDCPLKEVTCPHSATLRCTWSGWRSDLGPHLEGRASVDLHAALAVSLLAVKDTEVRALTEELAELRRQNQALADSVASLSSLKPKLPFSPMRGKPVILPSVLQKVDLPGEYEVEERAVVSIKPFLSFASKQAESKTPRMFLSNVPIPVCDAVYYFEVYLEQCPAGGIVGIGLFPFSPQVMPNQMPGWTDGSFGYHGDDGRKFGSLGPAGAPFGPTYGLHDTVGCGFDQRKRQVFFSLNGRFLGVAFEGVPLVPYWPVVGLHSAGVRVAVNYGLKPFRMQPIEDSKQEK